MIHYEHLIWVNNSIKRKLPCGCCGYVTDRSEYVTEVVLDYAHDVVNIFIIHGLGTLHCGKMIIRHRFGGLTFRAVREHRAHSGSVLRDLNESSVTFAPGQLQEHVEHLFTKILPQQFSP